MQTEIKKTENLLDEKNLSLLLEKTKTKKVAESNSKTSAKLLKGETNEMSPKEIKAKRKKARKELFDYFMPNFINALHSKNSAKLKESADAFLKFYKETYSVNDFSIRSMYQGSDISFNYNYTKNFIESFKLYLSLTEKK